MKKLIVLSVLLVMVIFVSAQTASLSGKGLFIDNFNLSEKWQSADLITVLGEPERADKKAFIDTYDKKGIEVFQRSAKKKATGKLSEIQFHLIANDTSAYAPKDFFSGQFMVHDVPVSKATGYSQLAPLLKDWQKMESYSLHNYKYVNNFLYVYFMFNEAETELRKVCIGPVVSK